MHTTFTKPYARFQTTFVILFISLIFGLPTTAQPTSVTLGQTTYVDSVYSEVLGEYRIFYVQFPSYYSPGNKYAVAYILDGGSLLSTVGEFQKYYDGGFTPEMILIGVSNRENRDRDLTPTKVQERHGMAVENGGAEAFHQFLSEELIPHVEKEYPVTDYRTLIGHSFGGLFAVYSSLHHPNVFSNYLAIDPSLEWDSEVILNQLMAENAPLNYSNKSMYITMSGQLHWQNADITIDNVRQDTTEFTAFSRAILTAVDFFNVQETQQPEGFKDFHFDWKYYPADLHGTVPFPSIHDGLVSMFSWYQMENTDKINSFETSQEELYKIIKHREAKLKKHFGYFVAPYPEELLNVSGYMRMESGQYSVANMYFRLAIEYYPQSANAHDSMADFYESQEEWEEALGEVKKAQALSPSEYYQNRIEKLSQRMEKE
ncbi:MAG: hypothetical protein SchgKO_21380 [Schleiferiaceae bacterium]